MAKGIIHLISLFFQSHIYIYYVTPVVYIIMAKHHVYLGLTEHNRISFNQFIIIIIFILLLLLLFLTAFLLLLMAYKVLSLCCLVLFCTFVVYRNYLIEKNLKENSHIKRNKNGHYKQRKKTKCLHVKSVLLLFLICQKLASVGPVQQEIKLPLH